MWSILYTFASTAVPQKTTGTTFYGKGGLKHVEDVYMTLLPGTDHETGHFWEKSCHENCVKFLPLTASSSLVDSPEMIYKQRAPKCAKDMVM